MKEELDLVCHALADTGAPVDTQRMVRFTRGRLQAYGGEVAVSVPIKVPDVEGALFPDRLKEFYAQPRVNERFVVEGGRLSIKADVRTQYFDLCSEMDIPFLDVIGHTRKLTDPWTEERLKIFQAALSVCDPLADRTMCQGPTFVGGSMITTDGKILFAGESGIPDDISFNMTMRAMQVVLRAAKISPVIGVRFQEGAAVAFAYEDGTSVIARYIEPQLPDDIFGFFAVGDDDPTLKFSEKALLEIKKAGECVWLGQPGSSTLLQGVYDANAYKALGLVESAALHNCPTPFMFTGQALQFGIQLLPEFTLARLGDGASSWGLTGFGDGFAVRIMGWRDRNGDQFAHAFKEHE